MPPIRPATSVDIPALLPMVHALAAHHGDPPDCTAETLARDAFGSDPWVTLLLAETAGYTALTRQVQLQWGLRGLDMHHLYVHPEARGTGVGTALLRAARDYGRDTGCAYVTVGTHPENRAAQAFYASRGFERVAEHPPRFRLRL